MHTRFECSDLCRGTVGTSRLTSLLLNSMLGTFLIIFWKSDLLGYIKWALFGLCKINPRFYYFVWKYFWNIELNCLRVPWGVWIYLYHSQCKFNVRCITFHYNNHILYTIILCYPLKTLNSCPMISLSCWRALKIDTELRIELNLKTTLVMSGTFRVYHVDFNF